jgi:drug/metabolite transporter (DMT)-like permease
LTAVIVYYVSSAASGVWNKWLVDVHVPTTGGPGVPLVTPTMLTLLHLVVALLSDLCIMKYAGGDAGVMGLGLNVGVVVAGKAGGGDRDALCGFLPRHSLTEVALAFGPIAICVTLSKLTTYVSYQYVSMALSHTAKASEPIFNVIIAALFFGEFHTRAVYLSLVPITVGIVLASVSDFSYNHTGFAIAVASALMKVLQNIATKRVMSTGRFTFWETHAYCGAASLLMLTPLLLWETQRAAAAGNAGLFVTLRAIARAPLFAIAFDSLLQWASSVSAYAVIALVSTLTATIVNVTKRLLIILAGVWAAKEAGTASNANLAGIFIAIAGVLWYQLVSGGDTAGSSSAINNGNSNGGALAEKEKLSDAEAGFAGSGDGSPRIESPREGGNLMTLFGSPEPRNERHARFSLDVNNGAAATALALGADPRLLAKSGGGGGGGGAASGDAADADESRDAFEAGAPRAQSSWLSSAIIAARASGVPRSFLATLRLVPPQEKDASAARHSDRRSSSGEWTGLSIGGDGGGERYLADRLLRQRGSISTPQQAGGGALSTDEYRGGGAEGAAGAGAGGLSGPQLLAAPIAPSAAGGGSGHLSSSESAQNQASPSRPAASRAPGQMLRRAAASESSAR